MRGKAKSSSNSSNATRITPAHAGKSKSSYSTPSKNTDHPRTCGEKRSTGAKFLSAVGSPPHMRGKVMPIVAITLDIRITPAHAGKSDAEFSEADHERDHPRTCGEKYSKGPSVLPVLGSPPHMRGKVNQTADDMNSSRITPAHAGKSKLVSVRRRILPDHPRTCGEKK